MDATVALLLLTVAAAGAAVALVAIARIRVRGGRNSEMPAAAEARAPQDAAAEAARIVSEARASALARREQVSEEVASRQAALEAGERQLAERHRHLLADRERLDAHRAALDVRQASMDALRVELEEQHAAVAATRQLRAGLDRDEAATMLLSKVDQELTQEHPARVQRAVAARVGDVSPTADQLIVDAIQRQDGSHSDGAPRATPLALEALPDESRVRLLSALEVVALDTFTDVGVDEDRQQVSLRGLDPVGREVARQASLEVLDRRLSAEEVPPLLVRTRGALRKAIGVLGERVLWEMGIQGRPELAELLGTLHYRFSYGQNALLHCQETGHICAALAAELGMDSEVARRAGLFHDIGKAVDHDVEGSHAIIGGEMLAVLGVEEGIVHAVKAHHFDEEPSTDLAMLTICADAISASRPGARRDTLTTYVQRLAQLQEIATRHRGVERAFPMQAGREVRVSVRPDQVGDDQIPGLCSEIAREIEAEMTYPGMIKVTVIRETSATATAS